MKVMVDTNELVNVLTASEREYAYTVKPRARS